jgi:hypothetical protein
MSGKAVGGNDASPATLAVAVMFYTSSMATRTLCPSLRREVTIQLPGGSKTGPGTMSNILFSDAEFMSGSAKGGNDTLFAGPRQTGAPVVG